MELIAENKTKTITYSPIPIGAATLISQEGFRYKDTSDSKHLDPIITSERAILNILFRSPYLYELC